MSGSADILDFVLQVLTSAGPELLIAAVGSWYALRFRQKFRRMAAIALCGLAAIVATMLAGVWMRMIVSPAVPPDITGPETGSLLSIWNLVAYLTWLIALALLLVAVYAERHAR